EYAGRLEFMRFLELLHRIGKLLVVGRAILARNLKPGAQQRYPLVAYANLERRPVRNASLVGAALAGSNFGQLSFEREVGLGVRLVSVERLTHVVGLRHSGKNLAWIWCALVVEDVA